MVPKRAKPATGENIRGCVRVRFAPSPTGAFHIGSARTALFNWLYARHRNGTFILRIEDTDKERNTPMALQKLLDGMGWLGLDWDEGPEVGGAYGPYFQSKRQAIYQEYLQRLRADGCVYDKDGAVWFRVSGTPQHIHDAVRGNVVREEVKDFVIVRSDGSPVFHFVNVVDDIAMGVTHVIRGEDHLSNTSKHVELFKAFGAPLPTFAHIPLILKSQGPGKMSKREAGALVEDYRDSHYLPQALRNYLCLLGWSPKDDREQLPIDELIRLFDLSGINKNNARFDERKLDAMNALYVRELPMEDFVQCARRVLIQAGLFPNKGGDECYLRAVLRISQEKVRLLKQLPSFIDYCFRDDFAFDEKACRKILKKGDPLMRLRELRAALQTSDDFSEAALETLVQSLGKKHGVQTGDYIHAVRLAVSGRSVGPSFYALLSALGKVRVLTRIEHFMQSPPIELPASSIQT